MYGGQLSIVDKQNQGDIYEDLSQMLKIFKKVMELSSEIVENLDDEETSGRLVEQLKTVPEEEWQLVRHYDLPQADDSPHKNTIYRFICRLYETVSLYKSYSNRRGLASTLHHQFLAKTQQSVHLYQTEKNVGRVFIKIFHLTSKFCQSCETFVSQGFRKEVLGYLGSPDDHQQWQGQRGSERKMHPQQSESNFHKTMNALNKRFSTLSCLDLEYNSFKSYYFQSRTEKQDLYKESLHRNALVWRQISHYSKQFSEYLKKRQKNSLNRKNRLRDNLQKINSISNPQSISKIKTEGKKTLDKSSYQEKQFREPQLPTLNRSFLDETRKKEQSSPNHNGSLREEARKTHYNLKNVYLTLNKVNSSSAPGIVEKQPQTQPSPKRSYKDRWNHYGPYKAAKISMKASKLAELDGHRQRLPLDIRHIDSKEFGFTVDSSVARQIGKKLFADQKLLKGKKESISKKSISDKKNVRIGQLLNKSSVTAKLQGEILNVEELMGHVRTINCEDER